MYDTVPFFCYAKCMVATYKLETFTLPRIAEKNEHGNVRQEDKERLYCYYFAANFITNCQFMLGKHCHTEGMC